MAKKKDKKQYRYENQTKKGLELIGVSKGALIIPEKVVEETRNKKAEEKRELLKLKNKRID